MNCFGLKFNPGTWCSTHSSCHSYAFTQRKPQPSTMVIDAPAHQRFAHPGLGCVDAHGHGEAGNNQQCRVQRSRPNMQGMAASHERRVIPVAIDEVGAEHAAEEHDLRQQEQPHAKGGGFPLLLHALEMVAQKRRVRVFHVARLGGLRCKGVAIQRSVPRSLFCFPATRSRTPRASQSASQ